MAYIVAVEYCVLTEATFLCGEDQTDGYFRQMEQPNHWNQPNAKAGYEFQYPGFGSALPCPAEIATQK